MSTVNTTKTNTALSLWQHEAQLLEVVEHIEAALANGEEPAPEDFAVLEAYTTGAMAKRDAMVRFLRHLAYTEAMLTNEIKALQDRRSRVQKLQDRIHNYLLTVMKAVNAKTLDGDVYSIRRVTNPPSVQVHDLAQLPEQYITTTITKQPNKQSIKTALLQGEQVPGAVLVQNERIETK